MITGREVAVLDRNAAALGVSQKQLMESSGNAVATAVRERVDPGASVAIVAGRGNNGGDAFVAARFLDTYDVTVHLLGRATSIGTEIARENWDVLGRSDVDRRAVTDMTDFDIGDPDLVVDAMLGTGVRGPLREPERSVARRLNERSVPVIAVDVPSGLDTDSGERAPNTVQADHIVTFHDTKPGLEQESVTVADIGIPAAAERYVGPGDTLRLDRPSESHKGDFGRITVIGGGPYTGAPALTARAALRAGADLVYVAAPESVADRIQGYSPDLIVNALPGDRLRPGHVDGLIEETADRDVVVLGPGLGNAGRTRDAVAAFLSEYRGLAVVDADALQVVPDVNTDATLVCTPHRGEFRAMGGPELGDGADPSVVEEFAADLGQTLLVKAPIDAISDGETTRLNRTGNPGMTVGGTGDVLAGVTGALLSALEPVQAAALAAYVNGAAGDAALAATGHGLVATDLIDRIPAQLWPDQ